MTYTPQQFRMEKSPFEGAGRHTGDSAATFYLFQQAKVECKEAHQEPSAKHQTDERLCQEGKHIGSVNNEAIPGIVQYHRTVGHLDDPHFIHVGSAFRYRETISRRTKAF